jgi:GntR family transcriptional regulator
VSYLPTSLTAETVLEGVDTGPGRIYDRLEGDMGLRLSWVDCYGAELPTADEASVLDVPVGVPLLRIIRVASDQTGRVVEVNDTRMSSERFMIARPLVRVDEA